MTSAAEWIATVGTAGAILLVAAAMLIQQFDRRRWDAANPSGNVQIREGKPLFFTHAQRLEPPPLRGLGASCVPSDGPAIFGSILLGVVMPGATKKSGSRVLGARR